MVFLRPRNLTECLGRRQHTLWLSRQLRQDACWLQKRGGDPQRVLYLYQRAASFEVASDNFLAPYFPQWLKSTVSLN